MVGVGKVSQNQGLILSFAGTAYSLNICVHIAIASCVTVIV